MSYILEALRKADAERERGAVPDLHAQLLPGAASDDEGEPRPRARWVVPVLVLAVLLSGLTAWLWLGQGAAPSNDVAPAAPALPGGTAAPLPPTPTLQPAPATPLAPPPQAQAPQPALPAASQATPTTAQPAPGPVASPMKKPARTQPQPQPPATVASAAARADKPASTPARPPAKGAEAPASPKADGAAMAARWPGMNELPEELRRLLPPMAMGGSVYSPQAEKRMVIVNGQVFLEGATLAPELRLELIRPKSAVFSIRGQRFEVPL